MSDELTPEETQTLRTLLRYRHAKTSVVRRTAEQVGEETGLSHRDLKAAYGVLADLELIVVSGTGRVTIRDAHIERIFGPNQELTSEVSAATRARPPARALARAPSKRSQSQSPSSPPPLRGEGGNLGTDPARFPIRQSEVVITPTNDELRSRGVTWNGPRLARHFEVRMLQFRAGTTHSAENPGAVNKSALSKNFSSWMSEGLDGTTLRDAIDFFALNLAKYENPKVPIWKTFLARRAEVLTDMRESEPKDYDEASEDSSSDWSFDGP